MRILFTLLMFIAFAQTNYVLAQCASCGNPANYGINGLTYVWVGGKDGANVTVPAGSGEWNNACNWRISATTGSIATWDVACNPPQSHNDVYFVAAAFPAPSTITIASGANNCHKMIWDNAIPTTSKVTLSSAAGVGLDIFDELYLVGTSRLAFSVLGPIRLMSTTSGNIPITSNGQPIVASSISLQGSATTNYVLQDAFVSTGSGGVIFVSGGFNTNGQAATMNTFVSTSGNSNRKLNISNSTINIMGGNGAAAASACWNLDFAVGNYNLFNAANSNLIMNFASINTVQGLQLGGGSLAYETITLQSSTSNYVFGGANINHFYIKTYAVFAHNSPITVNNLYLKEGITCDFSSPNASPLVVDNASVLADMPCQYVWLKGEGSRGIFKKNTNGNAANNTLVLNEVILRDMDADITGGLSYTANNSLVSGNVTNWTVTSNAACPCRRMRFHNRAADERWGNTNNWDVWNGSAWVANTGGLPFICDDVEFDAAAFTNGAGSPTTNQYVKLDVTAYCRDLVWTSAINTNAEMRLLASSNLNVFGDFRTHPNFMANGIFTYNSANTGHQNALLNDQSNSASGLTQSTIHLWGGYNSSTHAIQAANLITGDMTAGCVRIYCNLNVRYNSHYNIIDTLVARDFTSVGGSTIFTNNARISLRTWSLATRYMNNTQVYLTGCNPAPNITNVTVFKDNGGFSLNASGAIPTQNHYTGNTTFNFMPDPNYYSHVQGVGFTIYPNSMGFTNLVYYLPSYLPNTIFHDNAVPVGDLIIHGDVVFKGTGYFYTNGVGGNFNKIWLTGIMPGYTGSMTVTKGKSYTHYTDGANAYLLVSGDFNAVGDCNAMITIAPSIAASVRVKIKGTANIQNTSIRGWNNTGNPVIVANNSINAGINTNVTINSAAPRTFYWRAAQGTGGIGASAYSGNWSSPNNWALLVTDIEGGASGCVPTLLDIVIFDNMSGPASNTCTISNGACAVLWYQSTANVLIAATLGSSSVLQIAQNLWIDKNATSNFQNYIGAIQFLSNGTAASNTKQVRTSNTILYALELNFMDVLSTATLQDALTLHNQNRTTSNDFYAALVLSAGTLNTNNQTVFVDNQFISQGSSVRSLILGSSQFTIGCNGTGFVGRPGAGTWDATGSNLTINAGTSTITFLNNIAPIPNQAATYYRRLYMGSQTYNNVYLQMSDERVDFYSSSTYRNLSFLGSAIFLTTTNAVLPANVVSNNTVDILTLSGSQYYYFTSGSTQTFTSPNGTLICNGSNSNYVNIESTTAGSKAYFRKDYGTSICLDYIKVKDVDAQRNNALCTSNNTLGMYFYAGQNSDNISGTAGGDWRFTLGIAGQTATTQNINTCQISNTETIALSILGADLEGYQITRIWHDAATGTTSTPSITVVADPDHNPLTPYIHNYSFVADRNGYYTFDVAVLRCNVPTNSVQCTSYVYLPIPNILVNANTQGICSLQNRPMYVDFYDNTQQKPIASVQDYMGAGDVTSLGVTTASVTIDPSITTCNGGALGSRPRLPRVWQITPTTNGAANVRLYFTQTELNQLIPITFTGQYTGVVSVTDLELWKFNDGQLCAATPTIVPFTVVNMAASTAGFNNDKAFTSTTGLIAIEFSVTSFSHFVLVPKINTLLATDFLNFDATVNTQRGIDLDWTIAHNENKAYFEVERSHDAVHFERLERVAATSVSNDANYHLIDKQPFTGVSYYRIREIGKDGQETRSVVRAVNIDGLSTVNIYPNPAKEQLNIALQTPNDGNLQIAILDNLGRTVYQENRAMVLGNNLITIPLQQLPAGIYYCKLSNERGISTHKSFVVED